MSAREIFGLKASAFVTYEVDIHVTNHLVGGIPGDPDVVRAWLAARVGADDAVLAELYEQTIAELGERDEKLTAQEMTEEVARAIGRPNQFKRDQNGQLVYETRCAKAALKEWSNIAYPGSTVPKRPTGVHQKKGLKSLLAETVFVEGDYIGLGVTEPDEIVQRVKHITGPGGKRSALSIAEHVYAPKLSFTLRVFDDWITQAMWGRVWEQGESNGLGAEKSMGAGTFTLERFEKVG